MCVKNIKSKQYKKKTVLYIVIVIMSTDEEWLNFINGKMENISINDVDDDDDVNDDGLKKEPPIHLLEQPICEDLYISTKTKVLYLNQEMDIHRIFWLIPIVEYWRPKEGVIKKQMKIVSKTKEEYEEYRAKLENIYYYKDHVIKQIDNPTARRIKFKDERKITVGISKKDIMNCRGKPKNAFYNCFAMILRFRYKDEFKEIHVKVFNTGKLEIPGILNNDLLHIVQRMILEIIQPHVDTPLIYTDVNRGDENVLINSNFNCGFYINRDKMHLIMRSEKYGIESAYDPCSYPGVKCKFYYNNDLTYDLEKQKGRVLEKDRTMKLSELVDSKKYTEISFMIFRTGSCLIVGNCSEKILMLVFEFIKLFLKQEYHLISIVNEYPINKVKKVKLRKRTIIVTDDYLENTIMAV